MKRSTIVRSSMTIPAILLGLAVVSSGIYMYKNMNTRQYNPGFPKEADGDNDAGALGMYKYFFNAHKNAATNSIDYAAAIKTQEAVSNIRKNHGPMGTMGLNWHSMGPSNVGGRTRSILIDNDDPTGQHLIAGGVSGGLWRSSNGGATWDSVNDDMENLSIGCIAQDANGNIFVGTGEGFSVYYTGEGFSTGILGAGIFESTDHGATFNRLPATKPTDTNSIGVSWAYTNRIAILPNNPKIIYAACNQGLEISQDGGNTFNLCTKGTSGTVKLSGTALDVKVSNDAQLVIADVGGISYYCYPGTSLTAFTQVGGKLPTVGASGRIEYGIAPDNHDIVYAALINGSDGFAGIYFTMNAVSSTTGGNWFEIGPGGSQSFNPYALPGGSSAGEQGTYDNTIGVFPGSPSKALFGGTTLWSWTQAQAGDSAGGWFSVTPYPPYLGIPSVVHSDLHAIIIDPNNAKTVYIGCDGGIYKSYDGANTWQPENRDYDVTQFYAITYAPFVTAGGEGIMGGTQDNGTPYMNGLQYYFQDGLYAGQGDGGGCFISDINPNAFYISADDNSVGRSGALSGATALSGPIGLGNAYTAIEGLDIGANIDSVANLNTGCFVTPLALYENPYDATTLDSMKYIADANYKAGDTIYPVSPNGLASFPYPLSKALAQGDTINIQNRVVSKMAVAFSASNGVWINMQAADFADPVVWMPIGGPDSKPNAFTGASDPVHCLAWSPNGDALFVGTEGGQFYRFSNLDSIVDTSYRTGALFSVEHNVKASVVNPYCRVISTKLTLPGNGSNDILGISVDPKNGNNVIVTIGGYGLTTNVYYSNSALGAATFKSVQGNLPGMPVYHGILDPINGSFPNGAILATEHGVWSTSNIAAASPVWSPDNSGMANTLVLDIRQQTMSPWECNNSGDIYLGTHGRGAWMDSSFFVPTGIKPIVASSLKVNMNIYPDPMNVGGTIAFTLPEKEEKLSVTIYDIQGRAVKNIPVADGTPGAHTIALNSQDMAPGVYLATLVGTNFRQTTRFVVTR